jgi:RNA polymerase sigma-70 factor (ECF subfamily)
MLRNDTNNDSPMEQTRRMGDSANHSEWLARIACDRDMIAFEQLFRHYSPKIHRFMIRGGVERDDAQELVQETMVRIWINAERYDATLGAPHTWIYTIARNLRTDHLRKSQRRSSLSSEYLYQTPHQVNCQEDAIEASLIVERFNNLSQDQVAVLELNFLVGMSQTEISEHLSLPLGTIKSRMRLAFEKLRHALGINK